MSQSNRSFPAVVTAYTGCCFLIAFLIAGCGEDQETREIRDLVDRPVFGTVESEQAYTDSVTGIRYFKNEWMVSDPDSPVDPDERGDFQGLEYYPLDLELVFRARLTRYDDPDVIGIETSTGGEREAIRYGYFDFEVKGQTVRLHGYKFTAHQGSDLERYIFIPFKDSTSGTETYAGGRYIDVEEVRPGVVHVDFNDAYNPYCVYNERFSCPLPPGENHIDVAIRAGEKNIR